MMYIESYNYCVSRREMLIQFLDEYCEEESNKEKDEEIVYDFLYLPIDFQ